MRELLDRVPEVLREPAVKVRARRLRIALDALDNRLPGLVVVCEAIERRHNVSAILRTAEAVGVHEVHLVTNTYKPSKGAAKGAERWLVRRLFETTEQSVADLKARGFRVYVADMDERSVPPEEVPVDAPVALLFGTELTGVTAEAKALADGVVSIPMQGVMQSLNVSVAAAISLYSVGRRMRAAGAPVGIEGPERERWLREWLRRETVFKRVWEPWMRQPEG